MNTIITLALQIHLLSAKISMFTVDRHNCDCISLTFLIQEAFDDCKAEIFHDYDIDPVSRRPRVLVQTAGHVAGAAFFYQKSHVEISPDWSGSQV